MPGTRPTQLVRRMTTIGGLNGCAGSIPRNDAILGSGAVARTRAITSAAGVGATAVMEGAHEAAHCPWEQQRSQLAPFPMLLQGISTGK